MLIRLAISIALVAATLAIAFPGSAPAHPFCHRHHGVFHCHE